MAKKRSTRPPKQEGPDFEHSLAEVQQIVTAMESGELNLTESLQQYETGIKQLKRCHALLDSAEQKVSLLSGFDADGNPITEPMGESSRRSGVGRAKTPPERTETDPNGSDPDIDGVDDEASLF